MKTLNALEWMFTHASATPKYITMPGLVAEVINGSTHGIITNKSLVIRPDGTPGYVCAARYNSRNEITQTRQLAQEGDYVFCVKSMRKMESHIEFFKVMGGKLYPITKRDLAMETANQLAVSMPAYLQDWIQGGYTTPCHFPICAFFDPRTHRPLITKKDRVRQLMNECNEIARQGVLRNGITSCNSIVKMVNHCKDFIQKEISE